MPESHFDHKPKAAGSDCSAACRQVGIGTAVDCARETFQRLVAPRIANAHHEYFEDLLRKDSAHARWVVVRLYLTIGSNVLWAVVASITHVIRRAG